MKTLIKEYKDFYLYEYKFNNGNSYKECEPKWERTDFGSKITLTQEEKLEKELDKLIRRK